ncbi:MAG: AAA family ATPase, partial [Gammaproteobacteria bacterium]|nr:AAA family ATPase [Gammaproteobacteria bacterium]
SPAYWRTTLFDLVAMVRQLGVPTWFLTLSAADLQWYDTLAPLFQLQHGRMPSEEEVKNLTWRERAHLLRNGPVTAARLFKQKVNAFFTKVLKHPAQPLGEVRDYFFRFEWQARGSPHIHAMIWIKDAPKLGENSNEEICEFVDKYMCANIPDENSSKLLHGLIDLQRHKHTGSCQKKEISKAQMDLLPTHTETGEPLSKQEREQMIKDLKCRYGFPKPIAAETRIRVVPAPGELEQGSNEQQQKEDTKEDKDKEDLQSRKVEIIMRRGENDTHINNYNPWILQLWQANMDIQFIVNAYACIAYICSYIAKAEQDVGEAMSNITKELPPDCPPRKKLQKYANAFMKARHVSVQEAVHRLLGFPMQRKTRQVVFLPTGFEHERYRMLKSKDQLQKLKAINPNSDDVFNYGMVEKYKARPITGANQALKGISLAVFAAWYGNPTPKQKKTMEEEEEEDHGDLGDVGEGDDPEYEENEEEDEQNLEALSEEERLVKSLPDTINLGRCGMLAKCPKRQIVRYHRYDKESDPDHFYHGLLLLFKPFKSENELQPASNGHETYKEFFESVEEELKSTVQMFEAFSDIISEAYDELDRDRQERLDDAYDAAECALDEEDPSEALDEDMQLFLDPDDFELDAFEGLDEFTEAEGGGQQIPFEAKKGTVKTMEEIKDQLTVARKSFNIDQANAFERVEKLVEEHKLSKENGTPFLGKPLFISGPGGTGKSYVAESIRNYIHLRYAQSPEDRVVVMTAPTGTAAVNIDGDTLHHAFGLPVQQNFAVRGTLGDKRKQQMRNQYDSLVAVIIDEISMVSSDMWYYLNQNLNTIMGVTNNKTFFGGLMIIVLGDFFQLPPVGGPKIFADPNPKKHGAAAAAIHLWRDLVQLAELTIIERQKDQRFAELLNRIRTGDHTEEDIQLLLTRTIENLGMSPDDPQLIDAPHIFYTNEEV